MWYHINHDDVKHLCVSQNNIDHYNSTFFFTFITQHFESWLLQVKILTFITWNLDLLSWNISWGKLKALNCDFDNSKYPIINSKSKFWITKSLLGEKVSVVFWVFKVEMLR